MDPQFASGFGFGLALGLSIAVVTLVMGLRARGGLPASGHQEPISVPELLDGGEQVGDVEVHG